MNSSARLCLHVRVSKRMVGQWQMEGPGLEAVRGDLIEREHVYHQAGLTLFCLQANYHLSFWESAGEQMQLHQGC